MQNVIETAAMKLTDNLLGRNNSTLEQILEEMAMDLGLRHISYLRFAFHSDMRLINAIVTYSVEWQQRYFEKNYVSIDPIISWGSKAVMPFDWTELLDNNNTSILDFFADAKNYGVGRNGISFPVRNQTGAFSLVSFTSDHSKAEWAQFKKTNMPALQLASNLINSVASFSLKIPAEPVALSKQEEKCLVLIAGGMDCNDIAEVLGSDPSSVKLHLDTARHKLKCVNITHAVGIAMATGVIPASVVNRQK